MKFRSLHWLWCPVLWLLCVVPVQAQGRSAHDFGPTKSELLAGFEDPPDTAKLRCYWWWLDGNTTADTITHDLEGMKAKGYGGVILVDASSAYKGDQKPPPGPDYGSPAWIALYVHALKVASDLGLEVSLSITSGGDVGILGGKGVQPQDALKLLTYSRTIVGPISGTAESSHVALARPPTVNGFYRQIAVLAYPLRHGPLLPGQSGSGRRAIHALDLKTASKETGFSMPNSNKVLWDYAPVPGEQDSDVRDVIDLTTRTTLDGTLDWKFPPGDWEVLRIGYTDANVPVDSTSGSGWALDTMSKQAFDRYWESTVTPLLIAGKPYIGKSLRYLVTDSWEAGGTNWTHGFRNEFLRRRGYDPVPYLPIVAGRILTDRETSNRFLADLRRTVGDLITSNYYDNFAQHAREHGLGTHPESGGPQGAPIDALETFRSSAFPQTEFWAESTVHRVSDYDRFFVKEASSAVHIYGKRYVAAEGFTYLGSPWSVSPGRNLKPTFDQALTEGLNRLVWHEFTSSPGKYGKPGIEYFAGTHLNPNVTWWSQSAPVLLAFNRAQFLMQQGNSVSDLLYAYVEQVPNFVPVKATDPAHVLPGYDYDVTDDNALLHRMVASGRDILTPEGLRYRAIALPTARNVTLPVLKWIEHYVRSGGTAIGLEPTSPLGLISPAQAGDFHRIASSMWGNCKVGGQVRYGKGKIFCTQDSHSALLASGVEPDFTYTVSGELPHGALLFDYVHRRTATADIYFVRNVGGSTVRATLSFRVTARTPRFWFEDTGKTSAVLVYRQSLGRTDIPLTFPPHASAFLVFSQGTALHALAIESNGEAVYPSVVPGIGVAAGSKLSLITADPGRYQVQLSNGSHRSIEVPADVNGQATHSLLTGPWSLAFPPGWGAPPSLELNKLTSWTDSSIPNVRYFAGTATYTKLIAIPKGVLGKDHQIWLDLGDVREIAKVSVNGITLRTLWHPPYVLQIDSALRTGDNTLSVQVTNLWPNRLIGDEQPSATTHFTHTNVRFYNKDSPLLPSGMLSPVSIDLVLATPLM
jgi:hypothetical protein